MHGFEPGTLIARLRNIIRRVPPVVFKPLFHAHDCVGDFLAKCVGLLLDALLVQDHGSVCVSSDTDEGLGDELSAELLG